MTKQFSRSVVALLLAGAVALPLVAAHVPDTSLGKWTYNSVRLKGKNAAVINSNGDVQLYQGSLYLGAKGTAPSIQSGGYYGLKVPFYNVGSALTSGDVVVSSNAAAGYGIKSTTTASTSVLGIAEGAIASGTVGYATVAGYAVVHTTGAVSIGDVLVSSASASGYAGVNNSPATATNLGVALSTGAAAGDTVLIRLR
jgi:hypothetical protein